ncbi:hypothetical protein SKAU_G00008830 [Synaphobranchus kaupii]|uniref:Uncharacterized protein n=1 Tax=Synaphobranchus kaupii TaxID=118154 RepID=A0A9Q1G9L8_SYNKA|nr:hypothetical protein SKAU_G00008830 [Synaphobranchus kaupii]
MQSAGLIWGLSSPSSQGGQLEGEMKTKVHPLRLKQRKVKFGALPRLRSPSNEPLKVWGSETAEEGGDNAPYLSDSPCPLPAPPVGSTPVSRSPQWAPVRGTAIPQTGAPGLHRGPRIKSGRPAPPPRPPLSRSPHQPISSSELHFHRQLWSPF